ncbi:hypothetical protein FACS1894133_3370 [Clostridia bacterium]|nr:hypothetical protein FACS1894133_3370 [Clostridia bacterium]
MENQSLIQREIIVYIEMYDGFVTATARNRKTLIETVQKRLSYVGIVVDRFRVKQGINAVHRWNQLNRQGFANAEYINGIDDETAKLCSLRANNPAEFNRIKNSDTGELRKQAVLGFLFSLTGFVIPIFVFSIIGLVKSIKAGKILKAANQPNGYATAGIVVSILGLVGSMLVASVVISAVTGSENDTKNEADNSYVDSSYSGSPGGRGGLAVPDWVYYGDYVTVRQVADRPTIAPVNDYSGYTEYSDGVSYYVNDDGTLFVVTGGKQYAVDATELGGNLYINGVYDSSYKIDYSDTFSWLSEEEAAYYAVEFYAIVIARYSELDVDTVWNVVVGME